MAEQQSKGERQAQGMSSTDELNRLLKVTSPIGWLALTGFGLLVLAAVVWGVFGKIPTRVRGEGIIIRSGGIFDVVAPSTGQLTKIEPTVGQNIIKGDLVARIAQPNLLMELNNAVADFETLRSNLDKVKRLAERDIRLKKKQTEDECEQIKRAIHFSREQLKWLTDKLHDQETLLKAGLITKQRYFDTKREIDTVLQQIQINENQIRTLKIKSMEFAEKKRQQIRGLELEVERKSRAIDALTGRYDNHTRVLTPFSGLVVEVTADVGNVIKEGQPILRIELIEKKSMNLRALVYVSPLAGKKVRAGMPVQIVPSTVKPEEYGFMLGKISYVSAYPASFPGMMSLLENKELVARLSAGGAPIQVYVALQPNSANPSGYQWSSRNGPPLKVESGTLCSVSVITSEQSPIKLMLPAISKVFMD